jgi:hypothetical protein
MAGTTALPLSVVDDGFQAMTEHGPPSRIGGTPLSVVRESPDPAPWSTLSAGSPSHSIPQSSACTRSRPLVSALIKICKNSVLTRIGITDMVLSLLALDHDQRSWGFACGGYAVSI